jgi:hypothetical protein
LELPHQPQTDKTRQYLVCRKEDIERGNETSCEAEELVGKTLEISWESGCQINNCVQAEISKSFGAINAAGLLSEKLFQFSRV